MFQFVDLDNFTKDLVALSVKLNKSENTQTKEDIATIIDEFTGYNGGIELLLSDVLCSEIRIHAVR